METLTMDLGTPAPGFTLQMQKEQSFLSPSLLILEHEARRTEAEDQSYCAEKGDDGAGAAVACAPRQPHPVLALLHASTFQ